METQNFGGLRVAAFESRRAAELARLIEKQNGQAFVSPSMREVPLGNNSPAVEFAKAVVAGEIDVVIFTTGVGFRHLLSAIEGSTDREPWAAARGKLTTTARGPKCVGATKELGPTSTFPAAAPDPGRAPLATSDLEQGSLEGKAVGIQ